MFLPDELISFVFANQNDLYYCSDLLILNLNQYLWLQLHERYQAVYFLKVQDQGDLFSVSTYGDRTGSPPLPDKGHSLSQLFNWSPPQSPHSQFESWLMRELCRPAEDAAAFVCSLEDFCYVLSLPVWKSLLNRIVQANASRTGIFVLTASAVTEQTQDLLLSCTVFDALQDSAVMSLRSGRCDLYDTLFKKKHHHCLFLNAFTRERLHSLLLHQCIRNPEHFNDLGILEFLTGYLHAYLHDPDRQLDEPLDSSNIPASCMSYRELYALLSRPAIWNRLRAQALRFAQLRNHPELQIPEAPIHRKRDGYAGKCMTLLLPKWITEPDQELLPSIRRTLLRIRRQVSVPMNQTENHLVFSSAAHFLDLLDSVERGDAETYKLILDAVEFCVKWVYLDPDNKEADWVSQRLSNWNTCIELSRNCFKSQYNLELAIGSGVNSSRLYQARLDQLRKTANEALNRKTQLENMIRNAIVEKEMYQTLTNSLPALKEMEQIKKDCQKTYSDDDFRFRPEDYDPRPPI